MSLDEKRIEAAVIELFEALNIDIDSYITLAGLSNEQRQVLKKQIIDTFAASLKDKSSGLKAQLKTYV